MKTIWQMMGHSIDWLSVKLNVLSVTILAITGSELATIFAIIATATTIAYNGIRIYKELKKKP